MSSSVHTAEPRRAWQDDSAHMKGGGRSHPLLGEIIKGFVWRVRVQGLGGGGEGVGGGGAGEASYISG